MGQARPTQLKMPDRITSGQIDQALITLGFEPSQVKQLTINGDGIVVTVGLYEHRITRTYPLNGPGAVAVAQLATEQAATSQTAPDTAVRLAGMSSCCVQTLRELGTLPRSGLFACRWCGRHLHLRDGAWEAQK